MKHLLVLWDPENPIVPVAPVVQALRGVSDIRLDTLTFAEIGHQTLPNEAFDVPIPLKGQAYDAVLWIEGGPLPENLGELPGKKACWLLNTGLEPGLLEDLGKTFDIILSATLQDTAGEKVYWLPLAWSEPEPPPIPVGLSLLLDDPTPPRHAEIRQLLAEADLQSTEADVPLVVALGNGGRPHPMLIDCLRSGAAVVADPDSDLRGLVHVGEHLEVFASKDGLPGFVGSLLADGQRLTRLVERGRAVAEHLHEPGLRATRIIEILWPRFRILSGRELRPRISVLVTCYRYLKRFRVCLESLARQLLPAGALEIVVADPGSPDGLAGALEEFAAHYPGIRVIHYPIDPRYHRNRGIGINRAFEASSAPVVVGIDGDLVFPPHLIAYLEERILTEPNHVLGVRRIFVDKDDTERILSGEIDPFSEFDRLVLSKGDGEEKGFVGVLGYCQAVARAAFAKARYPEEFDVVNQSDIVFVERLGRHAEVTAKFLDEQKVLHLWHPRNWMGTNESL